MLPPPAVYHFPWEINSGSVQEGQTVRTFGRLVNYLPEDSKATLSSQHASTQHHVVVQTGFVEPFHPIIGAQYIVMGETETNEGSTGVIIRARVLNCVDGVNLPLLEQAINEQRNYFKEREGGDGDAPPPPT